MKNKIELKPFDKVLVRDDDNALWQINMFSSETLCGTDVWYNCIGTIWEQCIPYEGNEHLLGTSNSPQEQEKQNEVNDNYGYPVEYFKRNDIVLCRDEEYEEWVVTSFVERFSKQCPFQCSFYRWKQCIPYEGNEHLLGTKNTPERYNPNKDTLFGIKLKPGYIIEFENNINLGIVFPTKRGLAITDTKDNWQYIKFLDKSKIIRIRDIAENDNLFEGKILWERPHPKIRVLTKAEIAKKFDMNMQDFKITD